MMTRLASFVLLCSVLAVSTNAACRMANWWSSFDSKGFSNCQSGLYLNGLWRNDYHKNGDWIHLIEQGSCCPPAKPYINQPDGCIVADWVKSFDKTNTWNTCPQGYFLHGLYRSDGGALHNIEYAKCCKPADHPLTWGQCYTHNVWSSFDHKGLQKCRDGYFMTGLYRSTCDKLYCIENFKCCKMVEPVPVPKSLSEVKTRVMDETMSELALLAHYLGYGWCASCRAQFVGEDFIRRADSWEADKKGPCDGYKADHRLKMHYGDFKLKLKNIAYGKPVVQDLNSVFYQSGRIRNSHKYPLDYTVEREIDGQEARNVAHTVTSSWTNILELGNPDISYTPQGGKVPYVFKYKNSQTTKDSAGQEQRMSGIKVKSPKSLAGNTQYEYRIMLKKTRTTVPYTATFIADFSAELDGFLRWGGGYNGGSTNYHYKHRGSGARPAFKYQFGNVHVPFYKALKDQSNKNSRPWQWQVMKSKYSGANSLINSLSNEAKYELTLTGQFEDVIENTGDVEWKILSQGEKRKENKIPDVKSDSPGRVFPRPPQVDIQAQRKNETIPEIPVLGD